MDAPPPDLEAKLEFSGTLGAFVKERLTRLGMVRGYEA